MFRSAKILQDSGNSRLIFSDGAKPDEGVQIIEPESDRATVMFNEKRRLQILLKRKHFFGLSGASKTLTSKIPSPFEIVPVIIRVSDPASEQYLNFVIRSSLL